MAISKPLTERLDVRSLSQLLGEALQRFSSGTGMALPRRASKQTTSRVAPSGRKRRRKTAAVGFERRYALSPARVASARRKFLRAFPGGFQDETYLDWERAYKWQAHLEWHERLD